MALYLLASVPMRQELKQRPWGKAWETPGKGSGALSGAPWEVHAKLTSCSAVTPDPSPQSPKWMLLTKLDKPDGASVPHTS